MITARILTTVTAAVVCSAQAFAADDADFGHVRDGAQCRNRGGVEGFGRGAGFVAEVAAGEGFAEARAALGADGRGHGDLFISITVDVPRKLSREQRAILEQLAGTLETPEAVGAKGDDGERESFFGRVKDIFG